ncbi:MAG: polysaccharide deacetylase family protein [Planctomycetota bacterium]|nr:polysaccharide deacetylase family protein [Planctomycetota bacterium]
MTVVRGTFDTSFLQLRVPVIRAKRQPEPLPTYRQIVRAIMARVLPRSRFMVDVPKTKGRACLTFEDGPHPEYTPRILDVLKAEKVTGTFFLIGEKSQAHPDIVRRIVDEGHVVGNHTWTHPHPGTLSGSALVEEIESTDRLLNELTGKSPRLFRPPMGKLTIREFARVWRMSKSIVLWNNDPKDFACGSSYELRAKLSRRPIEPGNIVLMHDNQPFSGDVLSETISHAKRRGIRFSELPIQ